MRCMVSRTLASQLKLFVLSSVLYSAVQLAPGSSAVVMQLQFKSSCLCVQPQGQRASRPLRSVFVWERPHVLKILHEFPSRRTVGGAIAAKPNWSSYNRSWGPVAVVSMAAVSSARRCDKTITLPDSHASSLDSFVDDNESFLVLSHHVTCSDGVYDGFSNSVWACSFLTWLFAISARTFRSLQN